MNTGKFVDVEVYAVCIDTSMTGGRNTSKEWATWINVHGYLSLTPDFHDLYDVHSFTGCFFAWQEKVSLSGKNIPDGSAWSKILNRKKKHEKENTKFITTNNDATYIPSWLFCSVGLFIFQGICAQRGWEKMSLRIVKDLNDVFFIDSLGGLDRRKFRHYFTYPWMRMTLEIQPSSTSSFLQSVWFQNDTYRLALSEFPGSCFNQWQRENWSHLPIRPSRRIDYIMFFDPCPMDAVVGDGRDHPGIRQDGGNEWQFQFVE